MLPRGDHAIDPHLEQVLDAGGDEDVAAVGAGRHHGAAQPRIPGCADIADRALVRLHPLFLDQFQQDHVLAVTQAVDGLGVRGIVGAAFGQFDATGLQERSGPVGPWLPVDILVVILDRVERRVRLASAFCALTQEAVEHLFPRGIMHLGGLGQDTVEVEEAAADTIRETDHASSVRESILAAAFAGVTSRKYVPEVHAAAPDPGRDR